MKKYLLLTVVTIAFLVSCTMQKRLYRPGFFVQWYGHPKDAPTLPEREKKNRFNSSDKPMKDNFITQATESNQSLPGNSESEMKPIPLTKKKSLYKHNHSPKIAADEVIPKTISTINSRPHKEKKQNKNGDGLIYLATLLMGLATMGLLRGKRKAVTDITRWAKANPKKAQRLIAALQLPLLGLAYYSGHNLKELGYEVSDTLPYIYGTMLALSFLSVPFLARQSSIAIPSQVNRQRLGYLGITLSSLMLTASLGNNISYQYPNSRLTHFVENFDQSIFSPEIIQHTGFTDYKKPSPSIQKQREAMAGISAGGAVILIFLLCIVVCAGLCLAIFGVAGLASGQPVGILGILLGGLIFWLGIKGIQSVSRNRRETKEMEK